MEKWPASSIHSVDQCFIRAGRTMSTSVNSSCTQDSPGMRTTGVQIYKIHKCRSLYRAENTVVYCVCTYTYMHIYIYMYVWELYLCSVYPSKLTLSPLSRCSHMRWHAVGLSLWVCICKYLSASVKATVMNTWRHFEPIETNLTHNTTVFWHAETKHWPACTQLTHLSCMLITNALWRNTFTIFTQMKEVSRGIWIVQHLQLY